MAKRSKIEIRPKIIQMITSTNEETYRLGISMIKAELRKGNHIGWYTLEDADCSYEYRLYFHSGQDAEKRAWLMVQSIKKSTGVSWRFKEEGRMW